MPSALGNTIVINRGTLQIAHETNDILRAQEAQIRDTEHRIEAIDDDMDLADGKAGRINSCCGYGFWHWLKRKLCCLDGDAVAIRKSNARDLRKTEAKITLPSEPTYVPALVAEDSFDRELGIIAHQVEELRQDALYKCQQLDLQNKMLGVTAKQTTATGTHTARVGRYLRRTN